MYQLMKNLLYLIRKQGKKLKDLINKKHPKLDKKIKSFVAL